MADDMIKPTITFDTNCIINLEHNQYLDQLFQWSKSGQIDIFKTDVVDTELKKEESIRKSKQIIEDMGVGRIGFMRVDHAKVGVDDDNSYFQELMLVVFPETKGENPNKNKVFDIMNLVTHKLYQRDIFLTDDKDYLRKKIELSQHEITVMNPQECVSHLRSILNNE